MYQPISCQYYDELELLSMRGEPCLIIYTNPDAPDTSVESAIINVFSRQKEEFMTLADGTEIRLDRLVSVNGKKPTESLYC